MLQKVFSEFRTFYCRRRCSTGSTFDVFSTPPTPFDALPLRSKISPSPRCRRRTFELFSRPTFWRGLSLGQLPERLQRVPGKEIRLIFFYEFGRSTSTWPTCVHSILLKHTVVSQAVYGHQIIAIIKGFFCALFCGKLARLFTNPTKISSR